MISRMKREIFYLREMENNGHNSAEKTEEARVPGRPSEARAAANATVAEGLRSAPEGMQTNSAHWPLLLKDIETMNVKSTSYTPSSCGHSPTARPISEHLKYGVINLDKPCNPSSHEVVTWIKTILRCEKTGHSGTLDPSVSGCLPVCLNRATRIAKIQQNEGKEYVAVIEFRYSVEEKAFRKALKRLTGKLLQRPPVECAVKRNLRIRSVYSTEVLEFSEEKRRAMFRVSCEAGTYIRTLCVHVGLLLGVGAHMADLRRTRSGSVGEERLVTMHDVLDAMYLYERNRDESYLRSVVLPLETLLLDYPRIVIKDSSVNAVCYGGQLTVPGVLRYSDFADRSDVLLVTAKGEAVALCRSRMASSQLLTLDHGIVCKTSRVIMEKDTYTRQWKLGPNARAGSGEPGEEREAPPEGPRPRGKENSAKRLKM